MGQGGSRPPAGARLRLSEREARTLLLIQAVEETDADGAGPAPSRLALLGRWLEDVRRQDASKK